MPRKHAPGHPTLVLLVRHGQTPTTGKRLPGRARGLHLSDNGRREAENAAKRIAGIAKIAAVYASPLERARETAMPIARACGRAVRIERGLLELDPGEWTGQLLDRLRKKPDWSVIQRNPSGFRFPGGESFMGMQARMIGTIERLVARHPGEAIVAVSHGDPIKATVAYALGTHLDLFQRILIATASATAIAYPNDGPMVLTVNSLDGDLGWLNPR